jgi:hypothetical protein
MLGARRSARLLAALLIVFVSGPAFVPAPAGASSSAPSPFTPGIPASPTTLPTPAAPTIVNTTTTGSSGGLSATDSIAIGVGALVVIGGISFFIWHDARRRAPVRSAAAGVEETVPGSRRKPKTRKLSAQERRRRKRGRAR